MSDLNKIVDELSKLTVVEAAELSKQLEEKWGVTAAAPVAAAPAASAAPAEEKTEFTIFLAATGDKKINVIKEVRAMRAAPPPLSCFRARSYDSSSLGAGWHMKPPSVQAGCVGGIPLG